MVDLNKQLPISLVNIQYIIDRVYLRYPILKKQEIILIVKSFFESIRYILINGDSISISNLFTNMRLYHFSKIQKNKLLRIVKVKLSTAKKMKSI